MSTKAFCRLFDAFGIVAAAIMLPGLALAQGAGEARALIDRVAEAMGGAEAILDVRTLEANGYGMEAYFWGGGNVTGDPEAVQKWAENPNMASIWDFDNDRYLTQYRHNFLFPFGGIFGHSFALSAWGFDGDIAYTRAASGNAQSTRVEGTRFAPLPFNHWTRPLSSSQKVCPRSQTRIEPAGTRTHPRRSARSQSSRSAAGGNPSLEPALLGVRNRAASGRT